MKKSLLIISIITTIGAAVALCYSTMFFSLYIQGIQSGSKGEVLGGYFFFILFNFFTVIATGLNLIPNIIHFVRCKKPVVIVFFSIAMLMVAAASTMLILSSVIK